MLYDVIADDDVMLQNMLQSMLQNMLQSMLQNMLQNMLQVVLQCDNENSISSENYKYRCNPKDSQSSFLTSTYLELTGSSGGPA